MRANLRWEIRRPRAHPIVGGGRKVNTTRNTAQIVSPEPVYLKKICMNCRLIRQNLRIDLNDDFICPNRGMFERPEALIPVQPNVRDPRHQVSAVQELNMTRAIVKPCGRAAKHDPTFILYPGQVDSQSLSHRRRPILDCINSIKGEIYV